MAPKRAMVPLSALLTWPHRKTVQSALLVREPYASVFAYDGAKPWLPIESTSRHRQVVQLPLFFRLLEAGHPQRPRESPR